MISRRLLLTGATLLATSAAMPRAGRKRRTVPSSSIPCPTRRPRTSRISMRRPWNFTTISTMRPREEPQRRPCAARRLAKRPLQEILAELNKTPESIRTAIRNNGGGHANHTMFWQIMGGSGGEPSGELKSAIDRDLGGFQKFQGDFNTAGEKQFGSGWVFVTVDHSGKLALTAKPNQDTPLMDGQRVLMGNDVWSTPIT